MATEKLESWEFCISKRLILRFGGLLGPSGKLESVLSRKMETHKRGVRGGER